MSDAIIATLLAVIEHPLQPAQSLFLFEDRSPQLLDRRIERQERGLDRAGDDTIGMTEDWIEGGWRQFPTGFRWQ
jgi:hypothetical protein